MYCEILREVSLVKLYLDYHNYVFDIANATRYFPCPSECRAYSRRCRYIWLTIRQKYRRTDISAISISDTHDLFMKKASRRRPVADRIETQREKRATMHRDSCRAKITHERILYKRSCLSGCAKREYIPQTVITEKCYG